MMRPVDPRIHGHRRRRAALDRDKIVRKVEIEPGHLDWQDARYGSGLHCCLDEDAFRKLVGCGLLTATDIAPSPGSV